MNLASLAKAAASAAPKWLSAVMATLVLATGLAVIALPAQPAAAHAPNPTFATPAPGTTNSGSCGAISEAPEQMNIDTGIFDVTCTTLVGGTGLFTFRVQAPTQGGSISARIAGGVTSHGMSLTGWRSDANPENVMHWNDVTLAHVSCTHNGRIDVTIPFTGDGLSTHILRVNVICRPYPPTEISNVTTQSPSPHALFVLFDIEPDAATCTTLSSGSPIDTSLGTSLTRPVPVLVTPDPRDPSPPTQERVFWLPIRDDISGTVNGTISCRSTTSSISTAQFNATITAGQISVGISGLDNTPTALIGSTYSDTFETTPTNAACTVVNPSRGATFRLSGKTLTATRTGVGPATATVRCTSTGRMASDRVVSVEFVNTTAVIVTGLQRTGSHAAGIAYQDTFETSPRGARCVLAAIAGGLHISAGARVISVGADAAEGTSHTGRLRCTYRDLTTFTADIAITTTDAAVAINADLRRTATAVTDTAYTDRFTTTPDTAACTAENVAGGTLTVQDGPAVTATRATDGTVTATIRCTQTGYDDATAAVSITFGPAAAGTTVVPNPFTRIGRTGSTIKVTFSVTPDPSCTSATVTGGTLAGDDQPALEVGHDVAVFAQIASQLPFVTATSSTDGTLELSVTCGDATATGTLEWNQHGGPVTINGLGDRSGTAGSLHRSSFTTVPLEAAVSCTVSETPGYAATATATASIAAHLSGDTLVHSVEARSTTAGTASYRLTCGSQNSDTIFEWTAATGTTTNPELTWTVAAASLAGTVGTATQTAYSIEPPVACTTTATGSNGWAGTARPVFSIVGAGLESFPLRYVEVTATAAGNVAVLLDCSGSNPATTANSQTHTFTFAAPVGTTQNPELTWTVAAASLAGTVGFSIQTAYSIEPPVACTTTATGSNGWAGTARPVFRFLATGVAGPPQLVRYVEVTATAAGTVAVLLDCSGDNPMTTANSQTHTFTFAAPVGTTQNPELTWTVAAASLAGTVGFSIQTAYSIEPPVACTTTATGSNGWAGTARPVFRFLATGVAGPPQLVRYVEVTATAAGTVAVLLDCSGDNPMTTANSQTHTFTFAAPVGTTQNPELTWTVAAASLAGTVGFSIQTAYSIEPPVACTTTATGSNGWAGTARPVFRFLATGVAGPPQLVRYVEVTATAAGTVAVLLDCSGSNPATTANSQTHTFTFAAPVGTTQNPELTWTVAAASLAGTVGFSIQTAYSIEPPVACTTTATGSNGWAGTARPVFRFLATGVAGPPQLVRYVEVTATAAGTVAVLLDCSGSNPATTANSQTHTFTFAAPVGTTQNPELTWTVAAASLAGTVGFSIQTAYSIEPPVACTTTATGSNGWAGTARPVFRFLATGVAGPPQLVRYVEVTATAAGTVAVLLDCSGDNPMTTANSQTHTFTFDAPTSAAPLIVGFESQRVVLNATVTVVTSTYTTTPLVACSLSADTWTDSQNVVTDDPASGAVAGVRWQIRYFSGGFGYSTAVEITNQGAAGTLQLELSCGTTDRASAFTFTTPAMTISGFADNAGRTGQELLSGFSTNPPDDAAVCRVAATDQSADVSDDLYDETVTPTPTVDVLLDRFDRQALTAVSVSSSAVGTLLVTLTCGQPPSTYTATAMFAWGVRAPGVSAINGFGAQQGATDRRLETLFTTDPRDLAAECVVNNATQDDDGNTVGLVDADGEAITTAVVTLHQPFPIYLSNGVYVWHGAGATSDTAGRATLRLTCDGDTADAVFTWAAPGSDESGTTAINGLRSSHAGTLDLSNDPNSTLWLYDAFTVSPAGATCTVTNDNTLYLVRLYDDDDTIEPFVAENVDDDDEPDADGERLLVVALSAHVEAVVTVTCSGGGTQTVRWNALHVGTDTSTGQTIGVITCDSDGGDTDTDGCLDIGKSGTVGSNGMLTLTDKFAVSPATADCTARDTSDIVTSRITDTGDAAERTLAVAFMRHLVVDITVTCSADDHATRTFALQWRALRPGARTLDPPPAAPCAATETQDWQDRSLTVGGVPCVISMTVGVERIVWYAVLPSDASCVWTILGTAAVLRWSIPGNITVGYSTRGDARYLRLNASAPGFWQLQGRCSSTIVDEFGVVGTITFTVSGQVRAVADPNPGLNLPTFDGFDQADEFTWWSAVNHLADCFDPSVAERVRYERASQAYTALLDELGLTFGYWHWESFQAQLDTLSTADRRRVEAAFLAAGEAQDSYLDVTDGNGFFSGLVGWIPVVGNALSQTQLISNLFEYVKLLPEGAGCMMWRLAIPASRDVVNVLIHSMGSRGSGCEGGDGPIEACDQGSLLLWPIEAVNAAASDGDDNPEDCRGPNLSSITIQTTDDPDAAQSVGIGSALAWALQIGADDGSGLDVSVINLISGTAGDGITADATVHANEAAARAAVAARPESDWGYWLDARGEPRSVAIDDAFGGHWFSVCPGLHADSDDGSSAPGVWDRLWSLHAFAVVLHAFVLLMLALLLYRAVRLLINEIGKTGGSGGGDGSMTP